MMIIADYQIEYCLLLSLDSFIVSNVRREGVFISMLIYRDLIVLSLLSLVWTVVI